MTRLNMSCTRSRNVCVPLGSTKDGPRWEVTYDGTSDRIIRGPGLSEPVTVGQAIAHIEKLYYTHFHEYYTLKAGIGG